MIEIILIGIVASLLVFIFVVVKMQQQQKKTNEQMEQLIQQVDTFLETMQEKFQQANKQTMLQIVDEIKADVHKMKDDVSNSLKKDLHTYIHFDEQQQASWHKTIQQEQDVRKRIQYLQSALNKFPSNQQFFDEYVSLLEQTLKNASIEAKKKIIEKIHYATRVFLDHCTAEQVAYAMSKKDESIRLGHDYMKQFTEAEKKKLEGQLAALQQLVNTNADLQEIEKVDLFINKTALAQFTDLQTLYKQTTTQLSNRLMKKVTAEQIKAYNVKAVSAFKVAHDKFTTNESTMKTGTSLYQVINELGGWDTQYLQAPTQMYYQSVYADIFGKLKPEIKPKMTQDVLNVPLKEVG